MSILSSDDTEKTGPMARKKGSKRKKETPKPAISRQMTIGQVNIREYF